MRTKDTGSFTLTMSGERNFSYLEKHLFAHKNISFDQQSITHHYDIIHFYYLLSSTNHNLQNARSLEK